MKLRSVTALILALSILLLFCGCSNEEDIKPVYQSVNFTFTEDMAMYMASYTMMMLEDEMKAAGVDTSLPLSEQERSEGESWEDYLYTKTVESVEDILLYCEAAHLEEYTISEGMVYKANELVSYITDLADDEGVTVEEYLRENYGESVTLDALQICTQMMSLCEGYDLDLTESFEVTEEDAAAYADEHPDKFLKFNALRYTTKDKAIADSLAAAKDSDEFLNVMSEVSGYSLTDSDKNGVPDSLEVTGAVVANDIAGEFAKGEGRAVGDTHTEEKDGSYTVTMLLTAPERSVELLWNFRMIFMSSESSTDPLLDLTSLLDQWKEKAGGEEGFSNLASRYSDDPTAYYGGLFSGVSQSEMPSDVIAEWICDTARTEGDTTALSAGDSGAYMLYYIGGNTPRWMHEAMSSIKADKAQEKIDSVEDQIREGFRLDEDLLREIVKDTAKGE